MNTWAPRSMVASLVLRIGRQRNRVWCGLIGILRYASLSVASIRTMALASCWHYASYLRRWEGAHHDDGQAQTLGHGSLPSPPPRCFVSTILVTVADIAFGLLLYFSPRLATSAGKSLPRPPPTSKQSAGLLCCFALSFKLHGKPLQSVIQLPHPTFLLRPGVTLTPNQLHKHHPPC